MTVNRWTGLPMLSTLSRVLNSEKILWRDAMVSLLEMGLSPY